MVGIIYGNEVNGQGESVLKKNIAIFGMDAGELRTDVIFVASLDSESGNTEIISIPRDTKVEWENTQQAVMYDKWGYSVNNSKINEMLVYGGKENIRVLTLHQIEEILEMPIDNYVIVQIDAFDKIIDTIGGIAVEVPQRMYYVDESQKLYIDLQPGMQILDGNHAEMLVRFRKYPEGDVDRIKTQHIFLKALSNKLLSPKTIVRLPKIIPIIFNSIETDLTLREMLSYIPFITQFDVNKITYEIIPGEGRYEDGISYFFIDEDKLENFRAIIK
nr:LCP family protein [uncultured Cellulosilyticum sp.]